MSDKPKTTNSHTTYEPETDSNERAIRLIQRTLREADCIVDPVTLAGAIILSYVAKGLASFPLSDRDKFDFIRTTIYPSLDVLRVRIEQMIALKELDESVTKEEIH